MRLFALSDLHVDFEENREWVYSLSKIDFTEDILILAGDICDEPEGMKKFFGYILKIFKKVFFVPGNHDLWVLKQPGVNSIEKFEMVMELARVFSISIKTEVIKNIAIIPLSGWFDYSFGVPDSETKKRWSDFYACRWPENFDEKEITRFFINKNDVFLPDNRILKEKITFSHFMPRIDLMPHFIPAHKTTIYPFLGSVEIEKLLNTIGSDIHIYGHSHFNLYKELDGRLYINNAFGYPYEKNITRKKLFLIKEL